MNVCELKDNIQQVKSNIQAICNRLGITYDILVVGASKTMAQQVVDMVDSEKLLSVLGENRVQELVAKYRENQSFEWHFIGKLQTNKVKYIIDKVSLIHSVDTINLAKEIDKQAKKHNLIMPVLLQINMGKEESKSGFYIEEIEEIINKISSFENIRIDGIMAVMPILEKEATIKLYKELNSKWLQVKEKYNFKYLSAGMTNDYDLAIEYAGANVVRIGTAIFGKRSNYGNI
ncbi:MAG: YggS family pyridoxal phosphate-dependent enzyme [Clostridia bacterium]|nr:YggS family pyridoxal phosphate-dependent enzyme [Clostridia bacterium]